MKELNLDKLNIDFMEGVDSNGPMVPRKYTLTHSDETADLFLSIGLSYDFKKVGLLRDEVLGSWEMDDDEYCLKLQVLLDGEDGISGTIYRDSIFRRELPLAITAIVLGDYKFIVTNELKEKNILVRFKSNIPEYNVIENWGKISDYNNTKTRNEMNDYINTAFPMENINFLIPKPFPPNNNVPMPPAPHEKNKMMEEVLVSLLASYIRNEVELEYGRNTHYCLRNIDVKEIKIVDSYGSCNPEYEVTLGVRVGKTPPPYSNMIIIFLVSHNKVRVKSTKNVRR